MSSNLIFGRLNRAVNHIEGTDVVYIENPKCGCSSVKWSLIQEFAPETASKVTHIHERSQTPFLNTVPEILKVARSTDLSFFSIVRHPRARFISAYFDKMHHGRDQPVWDSISMQLGLKADEVYDPKTILRRMLHAPRYNIDAHIATQAANLFLSSFPYTSVFHLETVGKDKEIPVGGKTIELLSQRSHSTKARVNLDAFDEETYGLIDKYYEDDYAIFGYSPDQLSQPVRQPDLPAHRPFTFDFLTSNTPVAFLVKFFDRQPKRLDSVEIRAVMDRLTRDQAWERMPHEIMNYFVTYNVVRDPEMLQRFKTFFAFDA